MKPYLLALLIFPGTIIAAGFDCTKASSAIEIKICSDEKLSRKDNELNDIYSSLYARADAQGKSHLRSIQRAWLKKRNKQDVKDAYRIGMMYDAQIDRLNYLLNYAKAPLDLSNPDIEHIFLMLIENHLPSGNIRKFGNQIYLLEISNTGRVAQGLYGANLGTGKFEKILGGIPDNLHRPNNETDIPVYLYRTLGLTRGRMSTDLGAVYMDNSPVGLHANILLSFLEDGESGGCGRGKEIGIDTAKELLDYSFEKTKAGVVFKVNSTTTNCTTNASATSITKYIFDETGYKELQ